jgi:glycosyltransferase involved in cell wall biosynthesis
VATGWNHTRQRRVLFISYDYPDIGAAGVIRTYQLAKNLPALGWEPIILTAQPSQEESHEGLNGHRSLTTVTVAPPKLLAPFQASHWPPTTPSIRAQRRDLLRRTVRSIGQWAIPDGKVGWLPAAVKGSLRMARDHDIDVFFSVSPRPTSHLVARRVARSLGVPWVADYALPWSDAHWLSKQPRFIRWLDQRLEGCVLNSAQRVTVAYRDIARTLGARYGAACEQKILVVPTGFDEELFDQELRPSGTGFTVVYPGNHFCEDGRDGNCFLRAADEWVTLEPDRKDSVRFVFIGKPDDELRRQREALAHPQVFSLESLISHQSCIRAILSADACLVNTVGNRIPAKVYECMRAGKWILALTGQGSDLEALMRQYSRGISVPAADSVGIRRGLQLLFDRSRSQGSEPSPPDRSLEVHSCRHSAALLAGIFEAVLAPARG